MGLLSNRVNEEDLKVGDHIYSWRKTYLYSHHGIYIGNGVVIHFTRGMDRELPGSSSLEHIFASSAARPSMAAPCTTCGTSGTSDGVIESCLTCFLHGGRLYRFVYGADILKFLVKARGGTCTMAKDDDWMDVVKRARYLMKHGFGHYDLLYNNCEDFCLYCKTELLVLNKKEVGRSGQIASSIGMPIAAVFSAPLRFNPAVMVISGVGLYCLGRIAHDLGARKDIIKLPVEDLVTELLLAERDVKQNAVRTMAVSSN